MRRKSTGGRDEAAAEWRRRTEEAFAALPVGTEFVYTRTFSLADAAAFVGVTGDFNPLHQDETHASLRFDGLILPGLLTASMVTHIGGLLGIVASDMHFEYLAPVYPGETVTCTVRVVERDEARRVLTCGADYINQDGRTVLRASVRGVPSRARLAASRTPIPAAGQEA
jgi:acyl dehydratase